MSLVNRWASIYKKIVKIAKCWFVKAIKAREAREAARKAREESRNGKKRKRGVSPFWKTDSNTIAKCGEK